MEETAFTYRPGDLLVQGPARVPVRIAGAGTELEAHLEYRIFAELRVGPEVIRYYPHLVRPLTGNETDPVETAPS